jgi:hypothetical protein
MSTRDASDGRGTRPPPRPGDTSRSHPGFEERGRVTIDFSGPPLELPNGLGEADGDAIEPSSDELTLDTGELLALEREEAMGLVSETGDEDLDLDLTGFDEARPRSLGAADGWMLDREHRSSPPPFDAVRTVPSTKTDPPPVDPSRLRGTGTHPGFPAPLDGVGRGGASAPLPAEPPGSIADSSEGDALGLVDRSRPSNRDLDIASDMAERYALGDFTGALRSAELLLGMSPDNEEAHRYASSSRERLEQLYSSRLGALTRVAQVAVPDHEIRWLGLDHRSGFLLSRVDGCHSLEEILDVSGMPRLEALKTLSELVSVGAVRLLDG